MVGLKLMCESFTWTNLKEMSAKDIKRRYNDLRTTITPELANEVRSNYRQRCGFNPLDDHTFSRHQHVRHQFIRASTEELARLHEQEESEEQYKRGDAVVINGLQSKVKYDIRHPSANRPIHDSTPQASACLNGSIGTIRKSMRETGREGRYTVKCSQETRSLVTIKAVNLTARSPAPTCPICQDPLVIEPVFLAGCEQSKALRDP